MNTSILKGVYSSQEAEDLLTQMIQVKIKFHENKINKIHANEEDIKMRENCIKQLQKELYDFRQNIQKQAYKVKLNTEINIELVN